MNRGEGEATYLMPYTEQLAQESALDGLSKKVEPTPDPGRNDDDPDGGGVVRRVNQFRSKLSPVALESVGLHGMEIAKANKTRADELYRNQFPRFEPRFTRKCTNDDCGTEYDEEVDTCEECGSATREPSQQQRTDAAEFFECVNKEGQSLRSLYKLLARDAGRLGVWLHIVKKRYGVLGGEVFEEPVELVRGDPKRIKPVVDENGRIGGHRWACPVHRDPSDLATEPGECEECGADLREIHYAETDSVRGNDITKVFFHDEIVTHAPFEPRLAGHDGLSPVASIWLKQAILQWMDLYAGGFYDQNNTNRYPGKLAVMHTTNKQAVEKQLAQAQDEADEDAYAQGFIYNEVPRGADQSTDQVQVIDMMSDEILGQSDQLKQDYKSDIRSVYGLTDAQDSELEDAGGLNNEGLQLEVNDRDKAAAQQDLRDGPLQKLMDVLGYDDWRLTFVPPQREEEAPSALDTVRAAAVARQNGIRYEISDGRLEVVDTDGPVDPPDQPTDQPGDGSGPGSDRPPTDIQPPDTSTSLEQEALDLDNPRSADDPSREEALRLLEELQKRLTWPDPFADGLEQEARQPFFTRDEDMPQFVEELIRKALNAGSVFRGEYDAANVTGEAVKRYFQEKLDQPQGWSLRSLTEDFADRFKLDQQEARDTLQTQLTSVLNKAREEGYERQGDVDDRRFKWVGPADEAKTDACWELLRETNPKYGGTPRPLDELKQLVEEKREEYYPEFGGDEWTVHYNERDTFVEHFD